MKHTPGPWQQFDDGGAINERHTYGPEYADCAWGPDGPGHSLIADCSPHGQRATEETIANARLIAAAPELLDALEAAADYLYNPFEPDNQSPIYERIRAAIAKASPGGA